MGPRREGFGPPAIFLGGTITKKEQQNINICLRYSVADAGPHDAAMGLVSDVSDVSAA
jgi:hypothetical protein